MPTEQERQQNDRALRAMIAPGSEVNRALLERNSRNDRKVRFDADGYLDLTDRYTWQLVREEMIRQRDRHHDLALSSGATSSIVNGTIGFLTGGWINADASRRVSDRESAEERAYQDALGTLDRIRDPQMNRAGTGNVTMGSEQQRRVDMAFGNRRSDGTYTYGGHDAANQLISGGPIRLNNGTEYADAAAFVGAQPEIAAALRADLTLRVNDSNPYNSSRDDAETALAALNNAEREAARRRGAAAPNPPRPEGRASGNRTMTDQERAVLMNSGQPVDEYVIDRPTTFRVNGRDYTVNGSAEHPVTISVQAGVVMGGGPLNQDQIPGFSALRVATEREYTRSGNGGLTPEYLSSIGANRRSMTSAERAELMNSVQPVQEYRLTGPTTFRINGRDYTLNGTPEDPVTIRVQGGVVMGGGMPGNQAAAFRRLQEASEAQYLCTGNGGMGSELTRLGIQPVTETPPVQPRNLPHIPPALRNLLPRRHRQASDHSGDDHHALETVRATVAMAISDITTSVALTGVSTAGSIAGSPLASNGGAEITVNTGPASGAGASRGS